MSAGGSVCALVNDSRDCSMPPLVAVDDVVWPPDVIVPDLVLEVA